MSLERARIPSRYRLLAEVGQGGMAVVYRARDESLKRDVAIKVLHDHLSNESESKARLEREAQAVAKLKHDNILEIFDYSGGTTDSAFIVTEFIEGETLSRFLGRQAIRHPEIAALILVELGEAVEHAHQLGIIHRDIKPENVMIRRDGLLKLTDFGIAQVVDLQRMTVTGQLLGSPAYMSPELVEGRTLDFRSDVFALGILLYQCATGSLPFAGKNPHEVLRRVAEARFPEARTRNPLVGGRLERTIARCLAREPSGRYTTAGALVAELRQYLIEAGLTNVRAELRAYFSDPVQYEADLADRIVPALRASAERHLAAGSAARPRAIECWNRILLFRPNDPDVATALRRLERRARIRSAVALTAAAATMAGAIVGLVRVTADLSPPAAALVRFSERSPAKPLASTLPGEVDKTRAAGPPAPSQAARAAQVIAQVAGAGPAVVAGFETNSPRTATEPVDGRRASGASEAPARNRPNRARAGEVGSPDTGPASPETPGALSPNVAVGNRIFTLGPTPQNVDVYIDGEKQFSYDMDHKTLTVPWSGTHVVEFRSPSGCCFVERVEIGPDHPVPAENIIARKLKWKPARLLVTLDPPTATARIMLRDPERPGRGTVIEAGEEANVAFLASEDDGQKEIEIDVASERGLTTERLTVRAGQQSRLAVKVQAIP